MEHGYYFYDWNADPGINRFRQRLWSLGYGLDSIGSDCFAWLLNGKGVERAPALTRLCGMIWFLSSRATEYTYTKRRECLSATRDTGDNFTRLHGERGPSSTKSVKSWATTSHPCRDIRLSQGISETDCTRAVNNECWHMHTVRPGLPHKKIHNLTAYIIALTAREAPSLRTLVLWVPPI